MVFLANLPDADILPGYVVGEPFLYHRLGSHSLVAALAVGALIALAYGAFGRRAMPYLLLGTLVYASHVLLDAMTSPGTPLFWPILEGYVQVPWSPFLPIEKVSTTVGFFRSLLNQHNALVVLWEASIFLPLALLTNRLKATRKAFAPRRRAQAHHGDD